MERYLKDIYANRFKDDDRARDAVWKVMCSSFFSKFVADDAVVIDLAAGYCEFINNIRCGRKIAIDLNPETKARAAADVECFAAPSTALPADLTGVADVLFVSNFFEHLGDKNELLQTFAEINRVLKVGGQLIVLQPNLRLTGAAYWDFVDHSLPLTERSLAEAFGLSGFEVTHQRTRFLPYTMQSKLPPRPSFVRIYLAVRPAQWLLGKQTLMIGRKTAGR